MLAFVLSCISMFSRGVGVNPPRYSWTARMSRLHLNLPSAFILHYVSFHTINKIPQILPNNFDSKEDFEK